MAVNVCDHSGAAKTISSTLKNEFFLSNESCSLRHSEVYSTSGQWHHNQKRHRDQHAQCATIKGVKWRSRIEWRHFGPRLNPFKRSSKPREDSMNTRAVTYHRPERLPSLTLLTPTAWLREITRMWCRDMWCRDLWRSLYTWITPIHSRPDVTCVTTQTASEE